MTLPAIFCPQCDTLLLTADVCPTCGAIYALRWRAPETAVEAPQVYMERGEWENTAIAYAWQGELVQAAKIYAEKLGQPWRAGQLYHQAGEYRRVIDLLGTSEVEAERALAVEAAQAIPDLGQQAEAWRDLGEHLAAAKIFVELEAWLQAGECYEAAQAWPEARAAYVQGDAWEQWKKLTRELKLWDELVERMVERGDYADAAEVYGALGQHLKAAHYFDQAGLPAEALAAYSRVNPDLLAEAAQQRLAELAEQVGDVAAAIQAYQALRQWAKAAHLAETLGRYEEALNLYQQAGQPLKVTELLEEIARQRSG